MATTGYSYDALSARTIRGLRIAMIKNNNKHGMSFEYTDFRIEQGKWHCWFRSELRADDSLWRESEKRKESKKSNGDVDNDISRT